MSSEHAQKSNQKSDHDEFQDRLNKLLQMRDKGIEPFPNDFQPQMTAEDFHKEFGSFTAEDLKNKLEGKDSPEVSLSGRVISKRFMGKAAFLNLQDATGKFQIYVKRDEIGSDAFQEFKRVDLGDFLGVLGYAFRTKTDELTVQCKEVRQLCKALRPLPGKWHGLQDVETRYRQRYLDLIANEDVKKIFFIRSKVIQIIRQFLTERKFIEVETPMMQSIAGGAAARPFVTHHNALDMELFLRIAPELYLKRLVVGGFERVFEINRNFRNEGVSTQHNPEFTMLEFYQAYATYEELMDLTEEMIVSLVHEVNSGSDELTYQNAKLTFKRPWARKTLCESINDFFKNHESNELRSYASFDLENLDQLKIIAKGCKIELQGEIDTGSLQALLFEELVEATLIQPTFITQFPIAVSPLSRRNPKNPEYADRFELFMFGREIANAFSELNDPIDQRKRFEDQLKKKASGDEEAMDLDEDFLTALEHGMPPTAGEGIGIDRLVMILTNSASIREVILFPLLRSEKSSAKQ